MKMDTRTKYTRKAIRAAFFELLKETPLNRITVKSICEKADINRTTFYRYYTDAFDLMDQIEADLFSSVQHYIQELGIKAPEQAIEAMLKLTINNNEFYTILVADNTDHRYIRRMIANSYPVFQDGFCRRYPTLTPQQRKWIYYYMANGCISIMLDWVRSGMQESPGEVAAFMARLDEVLLEKLLD